MLVFYFWKKNSIYSKYQTKEIHPTTVHREGKYMLDKFFSHNEYDVTFRRHRTVCAHIVYDAQ